MPEIALRKWIKPSTISALAPAEWDDFTQRWAVGKLAEAGVSLPAELRVIEQACHPVDMKWLGHRLGIVWKSSTPTSSMEAKSWLHETGRLTKHLPLDIAAHAIDEAARASRFTPTAYEILKVAQPLLDERQRQRQRLDWIVNGKPKQPRRPWEMDARPFSDVDPCKPDEAKAIAEEFGIPRPGTHVPRKGDRRARGAAHLTVEDYVSLGLSRADAEKAIADIREQAA